MDTGALHQMSKIDHSPLTVVVVKKKSKFKVLNDGQFVRLYVS
jgi:hypothetical protein